MSIVLKGVQNIRTMSGRVDEAAAPYKAYMKISMLEMEKYRRSKEKMSAEAKLKMIDQRFKEIEEEKQKVLQSMEVAGIQTTGRRQPVSHPTTAPSVRSAGAFTIRY